MMSRDPVDAGLDPSGSLPRFAPIGRIALQPVLCQPHFMQGAAPELSIRRALVALAMIYVLVLQIVLSGFLAPAMALGVDEEWLVICSTNGSPEPGQDQPHHDGLPQCCDMMCCGTPPAIPHAIASSVAEPVFSQALVTFFRRVAAVHDRATGYPPPARGPPSSLI